jgi:hypothetical protein
MSSDRKVDRDQIIQKLTAEYNSLKMELEDAKSCYSQSNPGQMMHISDLKREINKTYKDLRWAYGMKAIEEEAKKKQTPE